jgi:hypothetical protein
MFNSSSPWLLAHYLFEETRNLQPSLRPHLECTKQIQQLAFLCCHREHFPNILNQVLFFVLYLLVAPKELHNSISLPQAEVKRPPSALEKESNQKHEAALLLSQLSGVLTLDDVLKSFQSSVPQTEWAISCLKPWVTLRLFPYL